MPWSVAPPRPGRAWVRAADAGTLRKRWSALTRTEDEAARERLFGPSRARTTRSAVAPLPGRRAPGGRLAEERGGCPEPVRALYGAYDRQWLIPDSRVLDGPRTELWRIADERQIHLVEHPEGTRPGGPAVVLTPDLPLAPARTGATRRGRAGGGQPRVRPLYRRPGGTEPNLAPGLLGHLAERLGLPVSAEDFLAWTAAVCAVPDSGHPRVPLTADPELWAAGVALGHRTVWLHTRGARHGAAAGGAERPRLPGGERPYVRAPLPAPGAPVGYEAQERALLVGEGRVSPVAPEAWEFAAGDGRVLEAWCAERATPSAAGGTLEAVHPADWPQEWTSELLELITVLTLLARLEPERRELARRLAGAPVVTAAELDAAGVLPVPAEARRPASVLDPDEEGPAGQLALL
ncbi:type ISP restriction/modification enzyme [Streptomyces sp. HNM0574]|uniref:type ISP restriction/modification enzyme n=1 Tax=Streptomyces sp. HNM0574 TaxID=2714954 RepID=UPI00146C7C7D|nr:type ISP restriction/modification enzyme [Streptomyces sp. HNM0574]NLU69029.1 DNA methyltransferase [Streptomyces sp. HNM0574]